MTDPIAMDCQESDYHYEDSNSDAGSVSADQVSAVIMVNILGNCNSSDRSGYIIDCRIGKA